MEGQPNKSFENKNEVQDKDLVSDVKEMLARLKFPESGKECIYRVPHKIRQENRKAYTPRVVSVGPIHNPSQRGGDNRLKPMEKVKPLYLKAFFEGTGLSVEQCISKLKEWEPEITRCYAEPVQFNSYDFLRMVLIDACFVIEHLLRYFNSKVWIRRDPLLSKPWLATDVAHDLILLENQLPFFVLERLYDLAIAPHVEAGYDCPSFVKVTFKYFESHNQQEIPPENVSLQHFTDLIRTFMLPPSAGLQLPQTRADMVEERVKMVEHLYSASQLLEAGVDFEVSPSKCLLDLQFHEGTGVLKMPCLKVFDTTEIIIRNIIAFEQCHHPRSPYISEYIKILDFLIDTGKDVNILVDKKIIGNLFGDADALAKMVSKLCSKVTLPYINPRYSTLCHDLNAFYENPVNTYKAIFIHEYWNTPWKKASTIAAVVLLLLTLIQTICSVISLFKS